MKSILALVLTTAAFALGAGACHGSPPQSPANEPTAGDAGSTTTSSGVIDEKNARDTNGGPDHHANETPIAPEVTPPAR